MQDPLSKEKGSSEGNLGVVKFSDEAFPGKKSTLPLLRVLKSLAAPPKKLEKILHPLCLC